MTVYTEGTHLLVSRVFETTNHSNITNIALQIPWFEYPVIYDVRAKPRNIASLTGTKGGCSNCIHELPRSYILDFN
jgi:hypothetical protein